MTEAVVKAKPEAIAEVKVDKCKGCIYNSRLLKRCILKRCKKHTSIETADYLVDRKYQAFQLKIEKEESK